MIKKRKDYKRFSESDITLKADATVTGAFVIHAEVWRKHYKICNRAILRKSFLENRDHKFYTVFLT